MILNVTYLDREVRKKIRNSVGKPASIVERIRKGGIGTRRMYIRDSSREIRILLHKMQANHTCNLEFRPRGVILRFRSGTETLAWVVSYDQLRLNIQDDEVTFSDDTHQITVYNARNGDDVRSIGQQCMALAGNQPSGEPAS